MIKAGRYYWSDNEELAFCDLVESLTKNMDQCPLGITEDCGTCGHFWEVVDNYYEEEREEEE